MPSGYEPLSSNVPPPPPTTAKCTEDGTSLRKASRTSDQRLVFNGIDALGYSDYGARFAIC